MQTLITPVQVWPSSANTLYIRAGNLGPPPSYYYQLQNVSIIPGKPAVVDLVTGEVKTPAIEDQTVVVVLKDGNASMTEAQWQAWPADLGPDGDTNYQLDCLTANLGLTRA